MEGHGQIFPCPFLLLHGHIITAAAALLHLAMASINHNVIKIFIPAVSVWFLFLFTLGGCIHESDIQNSLMVQSISIDKFLVTQFAENVSSDTKIPGLALTEELLNIDRNTSLSPSVPDKMMGVIPRKFLKIARKLLPTLHYMILGLLRLPFPLQPDTLFSILCTLWRILYNWQGFTELLSSLERSPTFVSTLKLHDTPQPLKSTEESMRLRKECIGERPIQAWFCLDGDVEKIEDESRCHTCWKPGPARSVTAGLEPS
ncbi:hypothetical protein GWK47_015688 [Chionoecetes opilio]|uniref:Uncharacterized protein n=1 Tax=Chionoecetes opilio TaxID=41210 RepID=A0A8J5BZM2_CHIOP|nr:hypothetical protein GWK47_015688 [Chionoecetes opilio]